MSLQALYQQRQRERTKEASDLENAWQGASQAFTNAAVHAHRHVSASCTPLQQNQAEVLAATQQVRQQIQELDTSLTAWTALLGDINRAFMEMGDLEHYANVIARQAFVVEAAVETIVGRQRTRQKELGPEGTQHVTLNEEDGSRSSSGNVIQ